MEVKKGQFVGVRENPRLEQFDEGLMQGDLAPKSPSLRAVPFRITAWWCRSRAFSSPPRRPDAFKPLPLRAATLWRVRSRIMGFE
jgi:hypothetical protein